jgi:hypothetical protein
MRPTEIEYCIGLVIELLQASEIASSKAGVMDPRRAEDPTL